MQLAYESLLCLTQPSFIDLLLLQHRREQDLTPLQFAFVHFAFSLQGREYVWQATNQSVGFGLEA